MDYRSFKIYNLIESGDLDWNEIVNSLLIDDFFSVSEFLTEEYKNQIENNYCSRLALVLEKYLKALYLKNAILPQDIIDTLNSIIANDSSRIGNNVLLEEDKINLLMSSTDERTNYLFRKLPKNLRKKLSDISFKGISHEFNKVFNDIDIDKNTYSYLEYNFLDKMFNISGKDFIYAETEEINNTLNIIGPSEVKDAFEKGRYSSITSYKPNFDALLLLTITIQKELANTFNGLNISESESLHKLSDDYIKKGLNKKKYANILIGKTFHIFPDIGTDITLYKSNVLSINEDSVFEYFYGTHKKVSAYKNIYKANKSKFIELTRELKTPEEIQIEIKQAEEVIGLVAKNNNLAKYIVECNNVHNKNGFVLDNDDFFIYTYNGKQTCMLCHNSNLFEVKFDYISKNFSNRLNSQNRSK